MKDKDTPLSLVRAWGKMARGCYDALDRCRAAKDEGEMAWPDYCPLPINAAFTYLVDAQGLAHEQAALVAAELTACWIWRQNKIIYSFDPELSAALSEQAQDVQDSDVLPADLLMHLPYPCIYIKAPGLLESMDGFWAWIDYDLNRDGLELRVQWVTDDMQHSIAMVMHIIPDGTLRDCFMDTIKTTQEHLRAPVDVTRPAESSRIVLTAIQHLLYILADNADIEDEPPTVRAVQSPQDGITQIIRDKASEIDAKLVGIRVGAAFRKAATRSQTGESAGTGTTKRPHMRRGHWHHYWTGPRDGERKLILRWTAPTMIHPELGDEDNVVIYPVKD